MAGQSNNIICDAELMLVLFTDCGSVYFAFSPSRPMESKQDNAVYGGAAKKEKVIRGERDFEDNDALPQIRGVSASQMN